MRASFTSWQTTSQQAYNKAGSDGGVSNIRSLIHLVGGVSNIRIKPNNRKMHA